MNNFPPARAVANHVTTCLSMCLIILFFTVGAAAAGGEFIWEYEAEYSTIMTPAVSDGNVYMPVSIKFMCLDSLTGSALWEYDLPFINCTAIIRGNETQYGRK